MATKPSLTMIPSGVKASTLYSVVPDSGDGDFTFDRTLNTAYRLNKDGLWELVNADIPRLHYELTDGVPNNCPCLILESASTNDFGYSEAFSSWNQTRSSITSDATTSPDGTINASKMSDDGSTGTNSSQRFLSVTGVASTTYTFSVFAKKGSMDFVALRTGDLTDGVGIGETFFNLATGAVGTTYANHTAAIEKYPNGWYRCSITFAFGTDINGTMLIRQASADGTSTVPLDGNSFIYLWGAMFEQGVTYPTTYIKTEGGSSTTRNAETCNDSGDAATFNNEEGVLYAEIAVFSDDLSKKEISISDGTVSNRVMIGYTTTTQQVTGVVVSGGSTQAEMTYSASKNVTDYIKIALKYKENDFELWIDGTLRATDTSGSVPASLSELAFDNGAGSNDFYGKCKDVRTYNTILSDSELAEITG